MQLVVKLRRASIVVNSLRNIRNGSKFAVGVLPASGPAIATARHC
jgi:hypothetical protein